MNTAYRQVLILFFISAIFSNTNAQFNTYWIEYNSNDTNFGNYLLVSFPKIYWIETNSKIEFQKDECHKEICTSKSIYQIDSSTFDSLEFYINNLFQENYPKQSSKYLWKLNGNKINRGMNIARLNESEVLYRIPIQDHFAEKLSNQLNQVKNKKDGNNWNEHDTKKIEFFPFNFDLIPKDDFDALFVTIGDESFYITNSISVENIKRVLKEMTNQFDQNINCIPVKTMFPSRTEQEITNTYEIKLLLEGSVIKTFILSDHYLIKSSILIWHSTTDLKSLFLKYREN